MAEHKVQPLPSDHLDYSAFAPLSDLPVCNEDIMLETCGDWAFTFEILTDTINEKEERIGDLNVALEANDATAFHKAAHAIKGVALNLHLPALVDCSKKAEMLGKQLEIKENADDEKLLDLRQVLIDQIAREYERIEEYLPHAAQMADQEQELEGEGEQAVEGEEQQGEEAY